MTIQDGPNTEVEVISEKSALPEGVPDAFEAGVDLLLICRDQSLLLESIEHLWNRVLKGEISFERLGVSKDCRI